MERRFYFSEMGVSSELDILVVFDNCFFWKGLFHTGGEKEPVLVSFETGRITEHPNTQEGYREVPEPDFWNETGSGAPFIRWALSGYDVHLSRMSLTPDNGKC